MILYHSTIRAVVLVTSFLCAEPILPQDEPPTSDQTTLLQHQGLAVDPNHCFKQRHGARDAINRIPASDRYWLEQDAVYIITPNERCSFLHLKTEAQRNYFIERFWRGRDFDPISLEYDFKVDHYRRIVFANQQYSAQLPGWKTDRGRVYVMFGPPDSVDVHADQPTANSAAGQNTRAPLHPPETWHYHYIKGLGENVRFDFNYRAAYNDYLLLPSEIVLIARADPNPDYFPVTPEHLILWGAPDRAPQMRFKDLEACVVSQIVRDQVKFTHRIEFAPATQATTLVSIDIQIPCESCTHPGQLPPSQGYPLFISATQPSGRVADTREVTADLAVHNEPHSTFIVEAHVDLPLPPGTYQLAIGAKNPRTSEVGILRTRIEVLAYEALEIKN